VVLYGTATDVVASDERSCVRCKRRALSQTAIPQLVELESSVLAAEAVLWDARGSPPVTLNGAAASAASV